MPVVLELHQIARGKQTVGGITGHEVHLLFEQRAIQQSQVKDAGRFGKGQPVASNETAEGRQQNRRVELVISGEVIGSEIGAPIAER